ncbi:hypothetical protein ACET3Z_032875 [Daucus carota]
MDRRISAAAKNEYPISGLVPGFRFHPTDEELVGFYLRSRFCGKQFEIQILKEIDVYKHEPWDLPGHSLLGGIDEWYFFSPVDMNYGNRSRTNRTTQAGFWKPTGKDCCVRHMGETIGMKKTLVFHHGGPPYGIRTNWTMHEYRLVDIELQQVGVTQTKDAFVLCRIFKKSGLGAPNGDLEDLFIEEEWQEGATLMVPGGEAEEDVGHVANVSDGRTGGNDIDQQGLNVGAEQRTTCLEETSVEGNKHENEINFEVLSEHFGKSLEDAANSFHVSRSTFKRICRSHGIKRWQSGKSRMGIQSSSKLRSVNNKESSKTNDVYPGIPPLQEIAIVADTSQDINKIDVKATYNGVAIRFELPNSSGMAELEDNVIERLNLERGTFSIKYKDEEGDWILIACDKDVQKCIEISRTLRETIVKMLVDLPVSHAP